MQSALRASLCLMLLSMTAADGSAAGDRRQDASSPSDRIVEGAGGRPYFNRDGARLELQVTATDTVELPLPPSVDVVTAARDGDAVWVGGHIASAEGGPMFLATVTRDGVLTPLPEPTDRRRMRTFPTLLAERESVAGMVWQEGDRQESNSIRAAAWLGGAWGPVEVVSPTRGREQTGLTATVLDDGSWLAVWAAVDDDDDLWWSRRSGDAWSEPRRVHPDNRVPDVMPRLAPTRDGALLVWTAYDGNDYRLHLAVLDGASWTERPLAGGRGAEPARWLVLGGEPALLFSSAVPDVWCVVRLDDAGRVLDRHAAARVRAEQPMVVERASELVLRWPQEAREEAAGEVRLFPIQEPGE